MDSEEMSALRYDKKLRESRQPMRLKIKEALLRPFCPTHFADTIFSIDYPRLKGEGIRTLLFDLDNTLVARDKNHVSDQLKSLFEELRSEGFKMVIVSNNWGERVRLFGDKADVPVLPRAVKPMKRAFRKGMRLVGAERNNTAVIGDQMFTDIYGANRLGLTTVLVAPVSQVDLPHTKILRRLEKFILKQLVLLGYLPNRQGDVR